MPKYEVTVKRIVSVKMEQDAELTAEADSPDNARQLVEAKLAAQDTDIPWVDLDEVDDAGQDEDPHVVDVEEMS